MFLNVEEVAKALRCSKRQVFRMADSGAMPWGTKISGMRRWSQSELAAWHENGAKPVRLATPTRKGGAR